MIVLDTNVISAFMRPTPDQPVVRWLDNQPAPSIWTTAITVFELLAGIEMAPEGRRRTALRGSFERALADVIEGRVLVFDTAAAEAAAALAGQRRRTGMPNELRDAMIAGIVTAHRATLATRNIRHFADLSVPVIDPWAA